ncbi:MAG: efflux RND transporter periplasmic adaptor subunit [Clostridia bacterium]|nr:efflux RND transporter periplasmic adaptor subunit [Clostridia bacterium]
MKSKKPIILLLSLLLLAALIFSACGGSEENTEDETAYNTSVEVVTLSAGTLVSYFELSGELDSSSQASVSAKVSGLVTSINAEVGQKVSAGQTLFTLDTSDLQDQIEETAKALEITRASIDTTRASLENQELTVQNQALTVDNQKLNLDNQQLNLDNQQLNLDKQQLSLDNESNNIALSQQTLDDAQLNYDRIKQLYDAGAVSQSELDAASSSLNQAKLAYNKTNTSYEQSKVNFEQVKVAYEQASVAYEQASVAYEQAVVAYEQAQTACKQYQSQINQAELQVQQSELSLAHLRESLSDYTVVSPISGQISSVSVHKGERIMAQSPVITLVGTNSVVAKINVAESSIEQISQGMKIKVTIPALKKTVSGTVTSISPTLDATSKAYPVEITLNNSGGKMKAGMVAKIQLASGSSTDAQTLPKDAVLEKDGAYYVYIVDENNVARQKNVEVGLSSNTAIEITSGLDGSEQVICTGNQLVSDGQQVNIASSSQEGE